ncbi:MAG: GTPase Era [Hyphomicrobiaceae bacterium hypho_1]
MKKSPVFIPEANKLHTKCGYVAIIGAPNAGKSTLVNQMVGAKISIVSHKVQTTRMIIRGIVMLGEAQIVLVDTPGIFNSQKRFDRAMVKAAWTSVSDADIVVLVIDCSRGIDSKTSIIMERLRLRNIPLILALNKIDKIDDKEKLLPLVKKLRCNLQFRDAFMLSAQTGDGVNALLRALALSIPMGPWHFSKNDISDLPLSILAAEITREKIYYRLHQELPYAITVETNDWKTLKDKSVRIEQTIFVEHESQKKIVIGKGGKNIKEISLSARSEITGIVGQSVHLYLFVKVRQNWVNDPKHYNAIGLEFPK